MRDEQAYLADVARRVREQGPPAVEAVLLEGEEASSLRDYARRESIDLVVLSTHGHGSLWHFWLGSVSDDVAHELNQPVLLVHPHAGKPDLLRQTELRSILVPLDGSPLAERALEPAVELGKLFDAEIALVQVNRPAVLPDDGSAQGRNESLEHAQAITRRERERSSSYLDAVAANLAARGVRVRTHVRTGQRPAVAIVAEAEAAHADLIAIETHGRDWLARLFLGSVADQVVRAASVPVLLHQPIH
jgi:nucleotide-binding universal stress UspA family protein